jgi:1,4-alpha-glucan branching enzyme
MNDFGGDPQVAFLKFVPPLSDRIDDTYLYLLPADPEGLYIFWEVGSTVRQRLTERFGEEFLRKNHLILRVYDVTGIDFNGYNALSHFEVDDYLNDKIRYWVKVKPGRNWVAELGYRSEGTLFFEMVARSNVVFSPTGREAPAGETEWADVSVPPSDVEANVETEGWRFNRYLYWKRRSGSEPDEAGFWSLVLHQHLPFVRHPEHDVSLEEQWFFEAVVSVYTQLIGMMWRLREERVDFRLTVSLTPPLISMMRDGRLQARVSRHIHELLSLSERLHSRATDSREIETLGEILRRLWVAKRVFEAYGGDLTRGYREFQDLGKLEVITCPATHYLLPLYTHLPEVVRAQIRLACRQYREVFGRWPRGIWLPENAFTPGLDEFLAAEGIRWTLIATRGLREGNTKPIFDTAAPVISPAGVAFFAIDEETRARIWSREGGYPGAPPYKEWYRDVGYDLPWEELPPYFRVADVRRNTGIKLHQIGPRGTSLGDKPLYVLPEAGRMVQTHAEEFLRERIAQVERVGGEHPGLKPCIVSAYDAELFGHWWEEGPPFIEILFRKLLQEQSRIRPVTPGEFLAERPRHQRVMPGASSWGEGDFFKLWVSEKAIGGNDWVYRHIFRLCHRLTELATRFRNDGNPLRRRALDQAARCLLLAGASDWGFLIATAQASSYASTQVVTHVDRTRRLLDEAESGMIDLPWLTTIEGADSLLPDREMDAGIFAKW